MNILGIDPGPVHSAFVVMEGKRLVDKGWPLNEDLYEYLCEGRRFHMVQVMVNEWMQYRGMPKHADGSVGLRRNSLETEISPDAAGSPMRRSGPSFAMTPGLRKAISGRHCTNYTAGVGARQSGLRRNPVLFTD